MFMSKENICRMSDLPIKIVLLRKTVFSDMDAASVRFFRFQFYHDIGKCSQGNESTLTSMTADPPAAWPWVRLDGLPQIRKMNPDLRANILLSMAEF
jgi:hypothetical protein